MTAAFDTSFDLANPQGLAALRSANDTPEARLAVAKQFESLFLGLMIRQMRQSASVIDGGLIDNDRIELQQGLFDQQLALSLARGRGIGLADSLLRGLGGPTPTGRSGNAGEALGIPGFAGSGTGAALVARAAAGIADPTVRAADDAPAPHEIPKLREMPALQTTRAPRETDVLDSGTPEDFVATLWPHAQRAAQRLGTVPEVLIAQAALETGWGRSLPRNQYGESSQNLFGIKADRDWRGPRAVITTLEFVDGVPERRREPFRMYGSIGEAFDDYVAVLEGRPRYAAAIGAGSAAAYAEALQRGGYATDPDYARKILAIVARGLPGGGGQVVAGRADSGIGDTRPVNAAGGDST